MNRVKQDLLRALAVARTGDRGAFEAAALDLGLSVITARLVTMQSRLPPKVASLAAYRATKRNPSTVQNGATARS